MTDVLLWWVIIQLFGLAALPLSFRLFRWLPDRGYTFAKSLGLLLVSYLLWLGASSYLIQNNTAGILVALLVTGGLSLFIYIWRQKRPEEEGQPTLPSFLVENRNLVILVEVLFTLAFVLWVVLRAYAAGKIMSAGGEKFMEITFLNGILRSPNFPPLDAWLSGFSISYYYFGYVMIGIMTRLSGVAAGVGFELYDALLFALTVQGSFGVVYNLIAGSRRLKSERRARTTQALGYGLLGSLFVALMGNLEGLFEGLHSLGIIPAWFWEWINIPDLASAATSGSFYPGDAGGWWWWRGSRVLADLDFSGKLVTIPPISEFPFFSFLLGDNHPHVLGLPFVILAIALALNLLRRQTSDRRPQTDDRGLRTVEGDAGITARPAAWWNPIATVFEGDWVTFVIYAVALGALGFLNTWDLPIYLALVSLAYGAGVYARSRQPLDRDLILRTGALFVAWLVSGLALYAFFYAGFSSQAGGILPYVFPPTRLPQYLIQFGPFIFVAICFLAAYLIGRARQGNPRSVLNVALKGWGWIVAICLGFYALVLIGARLLYALSQAFQKLIVDTGVNVAFGNLSLAEAVGASLKARLLNPWLFILLTLLLALCIAALLWRPASTGEAAPRERIHAGAAKGADEAGGAQPAASSDIFAFLLILIGLALTLSVEFFYLRDIFGYRMNTVFKFYFQGWVMLACASAYGVWWMLNRSERILGPVVKWSFLSVSVILVLLAMIYPTMAFWSRVKGFTTQPNLDGTSEIASGNPDDWAAIEWLNTNVTGAPVILEAPGGLYEYYGRISAFTGLPTVLGWAVHEEQWRGSYTEQGLRQPDIATIFTTHDANDALELLKKWQVQYVIVGASEKTYIQRVCDEPGRTCNLTAALRKFETSFTPVFTQGQMTIYAVP